MKLRPRGEGPEAEWREGPKQATGLQLPPVPLPAGRVSSQKLFRGADRSR